MLSDEMAAAVRDQVDAILSARGGMKFGAEQADMLNSLDSQVNAILQDRSLGRIMNGPLWLSGTSVLNGTITAGKLEVTELSAVSASAVSFNLTGTMTAAASFPAAAARVTVNSSGLWGYSSAIATTFKLNVDGSGEIGTGANKIVWTTGGAVTVPVATIGSLTIAAVGGGIVGGSYQTATTGAHINFSSVGIEAYNATSEIAANRTFQLLASTGAMTATGSFTVQSATSGARVVISNAGGLEGYNSGGTRTFFVNAATGAGQLGSGTNSISWDSSGNATIGSVALSGGKIVATGLSVTTLESITANMGNITAGTISASRVIAGTFINGGTGTVALGAADLSVASTGKVKFGTSNADYLGNDILHFEVGAGSVARIEIKNAALVTSTTISGLSSATAGQLSLLTNGTSNRYAIATLNGGNDNAGTSFDATVFDSSAYARASAHLYADGTADVTIRNSSNTIRTQLTWDATDVTVELATTDGSQAFRVLDSAGQVQFSVSSNATFASPDADVTALGAYAGRIPWYVAGNLRYIPYYN